MGWRWVAWVGVALSCSLLVVVTFAAYRQGGQDPRVQTARRIVVVRAADGTARDRYLGWITDQGGGGYFAMGDTWGVGGDFEWLARRVQQAIGGTVLRVERRGRHLRPS
jgi:hypothetical protein